MENPVAEPAESAECCLHRYRDPETGWIFFFLNLIAVSANAVHSALSLSLPPSSCVVQDVLEISVLPQPGSATTATTPSFGTLKFEEGIKPWRLYLFLAFLFSPILSI